MLFIYLYAYYKSQRIFFIPSLFKKKLFFYSFYKIPFHYLLQGKWKLYFSRNLFKIQYITTVFFPVHIIITFLFDLLQLLLTMWLAKAFKLSICVSYTWSLHSTHCRLSPHITLFLLGPDSLTCVSLPVVWGTFNSYVNYSSHYI